MRLPKVKRSFDTVGERRCRGAQTRQELFDCERLAKIVVSTAIKPIDAVLHPRQSREHQDRSRDVLAAQGRNEIKPFAVRQPAVKYQNVIGSKSCHDSRIRDRADVIDQDIATSKRRYQGRCQFGFIFEQQDLAKAGSPGNAAH